MLFRVCVLPEVLEIGEELELPELEVMELALVELELLELELLELELLKLCDHALTNLANLIPKCPFRDYGLRAKCHRRTTFGPSRHGDPNCHGLTNQPILAMHFRDCGLVGCPTSVWSVVRTQEFDGKSAIWPKPR